MAATPKKTIKVNADVAEEFSAFCSEFGLVMGSKTTDLLISYMGLVRSLRQNGLCDTHIAACRVVIGELDSKLVGGSDD